MKIQKLKFFFIAMITFAGTIHSNNNEFDHPEILTVHKPDLWLLQDVDKT